MLLFALFHLRKAIVGSGGLSSLCFSLARLLELITSQARVLAPPTVAHVRGSAPVFFTMPGIQGGVIFSVLGAVAYYRDDLSLDNSMMAADTFI